MIRKILIILVLISLFGGICAGGYYLYKNNDIQSINETIQRIFPKTNMPDKLIQADSKNVFSDF